VGVVCIHSSRLTFSAGRVATGLFVGPSLTVEEDWFWWPEGSTVNNVTVMQ